MNLPPRPFSDGDEDRPVPLQDGASSPERPYAGIVAEAEGLVREARAAMAREETDPYMVFPEQDPTPTAPVRTPSLDRSVARRAAALLLAVSCALAFAHGWGTAAQARPGPEAGRCGARHCQP